MAVNVEMGSLTRQFVPVNGLADIEHDAVSKCGTPATNEIYFTEPKSSQVPQAIELTDPVFTGLSMPEYGEEEASLKSRKPRAKGLKTEWGTILEYDWQTHLVERQYDDWDRHLKFQNFKYLKNAGYYLHIDDMTGDEVRELKDDLESRHIQARIVSAAELGWSLGDMPLMLIENDDVVWRMSVAIAEKRRREIEAIIPPFVSAL